METMNLCRFAAFAQATNAISHVCAYIWFKRDATPLDKEQNQIYYSLRITNEFKKM